MSTTINRTGMMLGAALLWAGCGGGGAEEPSGEGSESSGGDIVQYQGPIASTDVDHGKDVFTNNCDDCHPGAEEDVGPSLIANPHRPEDIRKQVREGSGKMRPFSEK